MIIGIDRRQRGPDPHLDWKVRIFLAGAVVALVGIALESGIVVGVATAILLVGFGLRFIDRSGHDGDDGFDGFDGHDGHDADDGEDGEDELEDEPDAGDGPDPGSRPGTD